MIKTIIFDADNTLYKINKTKAYKKFYNYLSGKLKISSYDIREEYQSIMNEIKPLLNPEKRKYSYGLKILFNKHNYQNEKVINRAIDIFWDQIIEDLIIIPEMSDVLEKLKKKFRVVITSDEFVSMLEKKLNKVFGNWENYFDFIVTPESVHTMKPSRRYYQIILERTFIKVDETVVIGDSWHRDLEPAKSLGIKTILISDKKEGYPDFWKKNIKDVLEILEKIN